MLLLKRKPMPLPRRREAEQEAEPMTMTDRVAVAQRNRSRHAAVVAVIAPEHAAKETQRRSQGAKVLTPEPEHVALPENGQECRS